MTTAGRDRGMICAVWAAQKESAKINHKSDQGMVKLDLLFLPVDIEMVVHQQDAEHNDADHVRFDILNGKIAHKEGSSFPCFLRRAFHAPKDNAAKRGTAGGSSMEGRASRRTEPVTAS